MTGGASAAFTAETDRAAVERAIAAFVAAFNELDADRFRDSFAADATWIAPMADFPERATGRDAVLATFADVFARGRAARPSPPYLNINPHDVAIQLLTDAAVVSFRLEGGMFGGRRTLVLRKDPDGWKIIHGHASVRP
jgi:ketosteroid isomerase-like protein